MCLACETVSDRQVMWAVAFIWLLSLDSIHCLPLSSGCQSDSLSISNSKQEQKELEKEAVTQRFLST